MLIKFYDTNLGVILNKILNLSNFPDEAGNLKSFPIEHQLNNLDINSSDYYQGNTREYKGIQLTKNNSINT